MAYIDESVRPGEPLSGFDLSGLRAVVTGAGRGIGRSAASALATAGAEVVAVDIDGDTLLDSVARMRAEGNKVIAQAADLRHAQEVQALRSLVDELGGVSILINAAGVIRRASSLDAGLQHLDEVWSVNVRGLYAVTQELLPALVQSGAGSIINVGSLGSVLGLKDRAAYAATKGAVRQYTQSLAVDLGPAHVRANTIAPGYIATEMNRDWLANDPAQRERLLERVPLGRLGSPDDLAGTFVYLASPASAYVTGQTIIVDGGWTAS
ncbi:SDR family NAD(P)-dependent oxidoreductase [Aeromicrobium sp. 9AM]|uniref:SDR family NAD(P)-dependent oxidoreductase n=1 Tax=Aeromicrobium sp. 9AM TaxID=2653126 RepID=UPI0012EF831C|nr:glucose 1-dehydrogenase [Aeromicrobium sp. 9AM]VXB08995.1 2-deoxy-D-gluconate 3-dehydrogenase [Aeromicrobium sp. 9AM]